MSFQVKAKIITVAWMVLQSFTPTPIMSYIFPSQMLHWSTLASPLFFKPDCPTPSSELLHLGVFSPGLLIPADFHPHHSLSYLIYTLLKYHILHKSFFYHSFWNPSSTPSSWAPLSSVYNTSHILNIFTLYILDSLPLSIIMQMP